MRYEFRFVVAGVTVDDDWAVDLLEDHLDAMLFRGGGVDLLDISFEGLGAVDAAICAARAVEGHVAELKVVRLDRDLVGIPEIADRAEVSRQNVHQWIKGERRSATPFPQPEGTAGRAQIWLWTEVNSWLAQIAKDDGCNYPSRADMADIDAALHSGLARIVEPALRRWLELTHRGAITSAAASSNVGSLATSQIRTRAEAWFEIVSSRMYVPSPDDLVGTAATTSIPVEQVK